MNHIWITGNIVADPEPRTTQSGIAQATFRVAVQRRFRNANGERETDFFNCVAFRQPAEFINGYGHKGDRVSIKGSVQNRSYDAQDGSKRYVTEVLVDEVEVLRARSEQDQRAPQQPAAPQPAPAQQVPSIQQFTEVDPGDDLPFD